MIDLVKYNNEFYYFYDKPNTPDIIIVNLHKQLKSKDSGFANIVFNNMSELLSSIHDKNTSIIVKVMNKYLILNEELATNSYVDRFNFINFIWTSEPNMYRFCISINRFPIYPDEVTWELRDFEYVTMSRAKQEYFRHLY